ncbi:oligopeptide:H+ symporter [Burkholderiaceae bacterium DAT-1]|nr:oligopeptide:H+ symporter [Burkholderiaceae bacterium DAT-1]
MSSVPHTPADAAVASDKLPRQIGYIVANEGCERFSFYGMRNILTVFLMTSLLMAVPEDMRKSEAKEVFHTFVIGVYFFPLLGGWLADRFFGKYNTIFWMSLIYCAGHACLAIFEHSVNGFFTGLFLIAFGSGGIKPLVSGFVGDQFDKSTRHLARRVFDAFYWIINFGSFFASLLMPFLLKHYGASVAFGIPGILMGIATLILWAGRHTYIHIPPKGKDPDSFLAIARTALFARTDVSGNMRFRKGLLIASIGTTLAVLCLACSVSTTLDLALPQLDFVKAFCLALVVFMAFSGWGVWMQLDRTERKHERQAIEGVRSVLRLLILFALVTPFYSLFDQKASTWIIQANDMVKPDWFEPSQMQSLNPLLVMLLIPFNNFVLFPMLESFGLKVTPLRRMGAGIAIAGLAWIVIGMIQLSMDEGKAMHIAWQILPYFILTTGEVLVSATGLEFAYSQAPLSMKGTINSFWNLTTTIGNLWVLLSNHTVQSKGVINYIGTTGLSVSAFQMFFFAGFALVAAALFALYARSYKVLNNYRD